MISRPFLTHNILIVQWQSCSCSRPDPVLVCADPPMLSGLDPPRHPLSSAGIHPFPGRHGTAWRERLAQTFRNFNIVGILSLSGSPTQSMSYSGYTSSHLWPAVCGLYSDGGNQRSLGQQRGAVQSCSHRGTCGAAAGSALEQEWGAVNLGSSRGPCMQVAAGGCGQSCAAAQGCALGQQKWRSAWGRQEGLCRWEP